MNDILKPELLWIEGRCYRVNDSIMEVTEFKEHDLYENEVIYNDDQIEDEDDDFEVTMLDNSRYVTQFHVSKHYVGSIIGRRGAIKNSIEHDTKTNIKIPKPSEEGDIIILGPSISNVKAARRRINMIVISSRLKQKATHFNSIPMNSPEIMTNFQIFKEKVLKECTGSGLEEAIFQIPTKLHLTLGVMCLMDNEERLAASKLLAQAKETIILPLLHDHLPLKIRLKGLSYMNDDPTQIQVLYGLVSEEKWESSGVLQKLADSLVQHFYRAGLMKKEEYGRTNVKLHVTLMNSKSASNRLDESAPKRKSTARNYFDGTDVLRKFSDFDFGVMELKELHLSQMHSIGADGYYQPTCIISCTK